MFFRILAVTLFVQGMDLTLQGSGEKLEERRTSHRYLQGSSLFLQLLPFIFDFARSASYK